MTNRDDRLQAISHTLSGARRATKALPGFPGELPESLSDAYEVQRLSREVWPDRVAGWKVGGVMPAFIEQLGQTRLAGPIFSDSVVRVSGDEVAQMPVFKGGFAAIEPEFIIELGSVRAEDRMYIGAEIASSPIPAINDVGPIAVVCDFGNNNGMIIGPEIENWQAIASAACLVETQIDGAHVASRALDDFRTDAQAAAEFLLAHAQANDIDLPAGTFISTGAITGVHEASIGATSRLDFGQFGVLHLTLTEART